MGCLASLVLGEGVGGLGGLGRLGLSKRIGTRVGIWDGFRSAFWRRFTPSPFWREGEGGAGRHGRRAAWLATGSACGAGHEEKWVASSPHQWRLLRGRLLARFGGSSDWARREREREGEGWVGGHRWVGRSRRSLARWGSPVLPFGPGFLVLS